MFIASVDCTFKISDFFHSLRERLSTLPAPSSRKEDRFWISRKTNTLWMTGDMIWILDISEDRSTPRLLRVHYELEQWVRRPSTDSMNRMCLYHVYSMFIVCLYHVYTMFIPSHDTASITNAGHAVCKVGWIGTISNSYHYPVVSGRDSVPCSRSDIHTWFRRPNNWRFDISVSLIFLIMTTVWCPRYGLMPTLSTSGSSNI